MDFLFAFIAGGVMCAVFQLLQEFTELPPPKLLIIGFSIGALLSVFGGMVALIGFGGAGVSVMVVNAGEAMRYSFDLLFKGDPIPTLLNLGIFLALTVIGLIFGTIRASIEKGKESEDALDIEELEEHQLTHELG